MNLLDIVIILLLLTGVGLGIQRGFLRTTLDLLVLGVSLYAGARFYQPVSDFIGGVVGRDGALVNVVGMIVTVFVALSILNFLVSWLLVPHLAALLVVGPLRFADKGFGVLPGIVYGVLFAAMLTLAIGAVTVGESVDRAIADSTLASRLRNGAQAATTELARQTGMDLADFTYIVVPQPDSSYSIPAAESSELQVDERAEQEMFDLVNQERTQRGIGALTYDAALQSVARSHSREMLDLGYFSHTSPNTGTLADRLATAGIGYTQAGENLAYAPSTSVAHRGLMQSEGHRANILEPSFQRLGIGVFSAPDGTIMVTQVFAR